MQFEPFLGMFIASIIAAFLRRLRPGKGNRGRKQSRTARHSSSA